jgi:dephospho-CoA kinase
VFKDKDEMKKLTDIVWPEIGKKVKLSVDQFRNGEKQLMVVEAAVLVEAKWFDIPDIIWTLEVPEDVAVQRIMDRNAISKEDALARIRSQVSAQERRQYASVEINTNRPKEETRAIVLEVRFIRFVNFMS